MSDDIYEVTHFVVASILRAAPWRLARSITEALDHSHHCRCFRFLALTKAAGPLKRVELGSRCARLRAPYNVNHSTIRRLRSRHAAGSL